jgi:pimeloyl-[acyl-carrier protein] methyl ester esterase
MSTLYYEQKGSGPEIVFIHGWGLHGGIWGAVLDSLAQDFTVTTIDLPGHGRSPAYQGEMTLNRLADTVSRLVSRPVVWLGWSLGALVAMTLARQQPEKVRALVLVAATAKFTKGENWDSAMEPATLQGFADGLTQDYRATLNRFLSLQTGKGENARELIRNLRTEVFRHGEADQETLAAGLRLLHYSDLRSELPDIDRPCLLLHGKRDRLTPPAAATYLCSSLPRAKALIFDDAGHAPFLSHAPDFSSAVKGFMYEL